MTDRSRLRQVANGWRKPYVMIHQRYSRKGSTSKAWERSESTNDGRTRQPKRAAGSRGIGRPKGEQSRARDAAVADGEGTTTNAESNAHSRHDLEAPCRDEMIIASLFPSRSAIRRTGISSREHRPAGRVGIGVARQVPLNFSESLQVHQTSSIAVNVA